MCRAIFRSCMFMIRLFLRTAMELAHMKQSLPKKSASSKYCRLQIAHNDFVSWENCSSATRADRCG